MVQHDEMQEDMQDAGEERVGDFVDLPPNKRKLTT